MEDLLIKRNRLFSPIIFDIEKEHQFKEILILPINNSYSYRDSKSAYMLENSCITYMCSKRCYSRSDYYIFYGGILDHVQTPIAVVVRDKACNKYLIVAEDFAGSNKYNNLLKSMSNFDIPKDHIIFGNSLTIKQEFFSVINPTMEDHTNDTKKLELSKRFLKHEKSILQYEG